MDERERRGCDPRPGAQTPAEVAYGIRAPLRAMAERTWNAGSALSLAEFAAIDAAIDEAPPTARCAERVRA